MTHYLTKEGLAELQAELKDILEVKKPAALDVLNKARAEGDLRENSAYEVSKEEIAKIEARIDELDEILKNYEIIEKHKAGKAKVVTIGGEVEIEYLDDGKQNYKLKIVGGSEANPIENKISNESPLAQAILDKKEGDECKFKIKNIEKKVKIIKIIS